MSDKVTQKKIDQLLGLYFANEVDESKLSHLEQDVWRQIKLRSRDIVMPWYEKIIV